MTVYKLTILLIIAYYAIIHNNNNISLNNLYLKLNIKLFYNILYYIILYYIIL